MNKIKNKNNISKKYLKINIFFFKVVKTNTKKERLEKPKKEKLLLLIPENIGDRVLSVFKTKIPTEYREKGIRFSRIKYLSINIFNEF